MAFGGDLGAVSPAGSVGSQLVCPWQTLTPKPHNPFWKRG